MSEKKFNRGGLDLGLNEYLGTKGQYSTEIESVIRPQIQLQDLSDSPYVRDYSPVGGNKTQAAVAAEFSYISIAAGPSTGLQIKALHFFNPSAGIQTISVGVISAADAATVGFSGAVRVVQLKVNDALVLFGASTMQGGSDAAATFGSFWLNVRLAASGSTIYTLPKPGIILQNNGGGAVAGLVVVNNTVNDSVNVSFYGAEWPLPG